MMTTGPAVIGASYVRAHGNDPCRFLSTDFGLPVSSLGSGARVRPERIQALSDLMARRDARASPATIALSSEVVPGSRKENAGSSKACAAFCRPGRGLSPLAFCY